MIRMKIKQIAVIAAAMVSMCCSAMAAEENVTLPIPSEMPSINGQLSDVISQLQKGIDIYAGIGKFIIAVVALVLLGALIVNITKFAKSGSNERNRQNAMQALIYTGIAIALLGGIGVIVGLTSVLLQL